jgi:hypothetical protein
MIFTNKSVLSDEKIARLSACYGIPSGFDDHESSIGSEMHELIKAEVVFDTKGNALNIDDLFDFAKQQLTNDDDYEPTDADELLGWIMETSEMSALLCDLRTNWANHTPDLPNDSVNGKGHNLTVSELKTIIDNRYFYEFVEELASYNTED